MQKQLSNNYVIISKDVSTDSNDGMVTIFKIVDKFQFGFRGDDFEKAFSPDGGKNIVLPAAYTIATSWSLEEATEKDFPLKVKVTLRDPDNKVINEILQEAVIAKGNDKLRLNINTQGLPLSRAGKYVFEATALDDSNKELAEGKCSISIEIDIDKPNSRVVSKEK